MHHSLSKIWGGGILSSSDGQRFPVSVKNSQAVALPRYFGYGRGLTFYTWTSDLSQIQGFDVAKSTRILEIHATSTSAHLYPR
ncbi:Tn3 family transposase [Pseudanabaena sp. CCNP1317]|nr:Tn3 family transposase [Pseudanabaena sp. CCNP1317]MEA5488833.1 Tn3 family transposase [Pseudanabaena sp. CCNP1317]WGS74929.1 Tn3 family transposase [Pseudanabaena galeata CCNP1313]